MALKKNAQHTVLVAVGTRPEAIKLAPVIHALRDKGGVRVAVCNTAQHRDMVDEVFDLFRIRADYDLDVMKPGQDIVHIQNAVLERFTGVLAQAKPGMVMVQGDTTTAFTAALAAFYQRVPVAHVEAGLRTFDKWNPFPEELNRRMVSSIGDLHFSPTLKARKNLLSEGVPPGNIHVVGNTVVDALYDIKRQMDKKVRAGVEQKFFSGSEKQRLILVTAHRRENWGKPLAELCAAIKGLAEERPDIMVVWPVHPNPSVRETVMPALDGVPGVTLAGPLRYDEFVCLLDEAYLTITDSGGIQEESAALGKPVLVFRKTTERPEVLTAGVGELLPCDRKAVVRRVVRLLDDTKAYAKKRRASRVFGSGDAAAKIARTIKMFLGTKH